MRQRKLGNLEVSSLGLGCMGMSEFYGETNDAASTRLIHKAVDLGITLFDTADMYGMGHNEILIGKALADRRDKVVIASKCGIIRDSSDPTNRSVNASAAYIKKKKGIL